MFVAKWQLINQHGGNGATSKLKYYFKPLKKTQKYTLCGKGPYKQTNFVLT